MVSQEQTARDSCLKTLVFQVFVLLLYFFYKGTVFSTEFKKLSLKLHGFVGKFFSGLFFFLGPPKDIQMIVSRKAVTTL